MNLGESVLFSLQALRANKVRSFLTGLGMVIGTASVILVVTIAQTSQNYILEQIEGVGSNMVFAQYEIGSQQTAAQVDADFIKLGDVQARVEEQCGPLVEYASVDSQLDQAGSHDAEQRACSEAAQQNERIFPKRGRCVFIPYRRHEPIVRPRLHRHSSFRTTG